MARTTTSELNDRLTKVEGTLSNIEGMLQALTQASTYASAPAPAPQPKKEVVRDQVYTKRNGETIAVTAAEKANYERIAEAAKKADGKALEWLKKYNMPITCTLADFEEKFGKISNSSRSVRRAEFKIMKYGNE